MISRSKGPSSLRYVTSREVKRMIVFGPPEPSESRFTFVSFFN